MLFTVKNFDAGSRNMNDNFCVSSMTAIIDKCNGTHCSLVLEFIILREKGKEMKNEKVENEG